MRSLFFSFYPWGLILVVLAIAHFIRRRPNAYWLMVILFFGPIGALIYIFVEVIPDAGLLRGTFDAFPRSKRIRELEAIVLENPAVGNYEELADLYMDDERFDRAKANYDKAIASRSNSLDAVYRRGIAEIQLGDSTAAVADLEQVISKDPKYDSHRATALLAHAYANTRRTDEAGSLFEQVVEISTLSETYYNYAMFLVSQKRTAEAREWAQRILAKKPTMPSYWRRRERPWFNKASALLRSLPG